MTREKKGEGGVNKRGSCNAKEEEEKKAWRNVKETMTGNEAMR